MAQSSNRTKFSSYCLAGDCFPSLCSNWTWCHLVYYRNCYQSHLNVFLLLFLVPTDTQQERVAKLSMLGFCMTGYKQNDTWLMIYLHVCLFCIFTTSWASLRNNVLNKFSHFYQVTFSKKLPCSEITFKEEHWLQSHRLEGARREGCNSKTMELVTLPKIFSQTKTMQMKGAKPHSLLPK